MKKVYISGPITGIKDSENNFNNVANKIFGLGYEDVNPCVLIHDHDLSYESYMKVDLKALLDCDYIYMMEGWENSKGASFELETAKICGIERLEIS